MKITIKPKDTGNGNYTDPDHCPIATALRRKLILPLVGPDSYVGLFLGFIPVWGRIHEPLRNEIHDLSRYRIREEKTYEIGLFTMK